jgi:hypothetical protein
VGAGSLKDAAAALGAVVPLSEDDAVATGADVAEPGVGAGLGSDVAPLGEDAAATDGDVAEPGVGAASLSEGAPALDADVAPLAADAGAIGPAMAEPGVGAGSLSEGMDASGGEVAPLVADVGALAADVSAKAIGSGDSEAKAAAASAMAETRRMLWVMETSISPAQRAAGTPLPGSGTRKPIVRFPETDSSADEPIPRNLRSPRAFDGAALFCAGLKSLASETTRINEIGRPNRAARSRKVS